MSLPPLQLPEGVVFPRFKFSPRKLECDPKYVGPLLVDKLPEDAWEKWCKDGVVCFAMGGTDIMKVYFADPKSLSLYHVTDFDFYKFERMTSINTVACVLLGSEIYMIGGRYGKRDGPTDVYYCDVATQPQLPEGGYEWKLGPSLNSPKPTPLVFTLGGNIYVLSTGIADDNPSPFEVLPLSTGSREWKVLPPPPPPFPSSKTRLQHVIAGSFIIDDKKIAIHVVFDGHTLFMYDPEVNQWTLESLLRGNPLNLAAGKTIYSFHVPDKENGFFLDGKGNYSVVNIQPPSFEAFASLLPPSLKNFLQDTACNPLQWHVIHLRGRKFFLIALYTDYCGYKSYARLVTFDVVEHFASDESDAKRLKLDGYELTNTDTNFTDILDDAILLPYEFCSKVGAFSLC